jgi:hypothetical protein
MPPTTMAVKVQSGSFCWPASVPIVGVYVHPQDASRYQVITRVEEEESPLPEIEPDHE